MSKKAIIYLIDVSANNGEGIVVPLDDISAIKFKYTDHPKDQSRTEGVTIFLKGQNKQISWEGSSGSVYRIIDEEGELLIRTYKLKEFENSYVEAVSGFISSSETVSQNDNSPIDGTIIPSN